uniref:Ig-like domain-containing protein n=1 Tax=Oryzias latipes TaxID=8090 RepID=A0A3P9L5I9_ORYLA
EEWLRLETECLLSVSGCFCESKTVEVQSGETVTLLCSDFTASRVQTDWFRVVNGTEVSCISSIFSSDGDPSFCDGFDGVKFEMNSNSSSVSLKISGVDESDSGLYFCGFYRNRHTVIGDVTQLIIKGKFAHFQHVCTKTSKENLHTDSLKVKLFVFSPWFFISFLLLVFNSEYLYFRLKILLTQTLLLLSFQNPEKMDDLQKTESWRLV